MKASNRHPRTVQIDRATAVAKSMIAPKASAITYGGMSTIMESRDTSASLRKSIGISIEPKVLPFSAEAPQIALSRAACYGS